jgi:hypothetical protein
LVDPLIFSIEWLKDLHDAEESIPSFEKLSNYRGEREIDMLRIWGTYFFPSVIGTWKFKSCAIKARLSKFFTVSDEAFAVTVLENFYDRWTEEGKAKAEGKEVDWMDLPPAKWTDSMCAAGKRKQGGWSNEGLERFNEHTTNIKALRETENSMKLEEKYMELMDDEDGENKRGDGGGYKRESEEVVTYDDLSPLRMISKKKQRDDEQMHHKGKTKKHRASLESKFEKEKDSDEEGKEEEDGEDSD